MLTFDYTPGLTKEKILSLVTEQEIIEAFLGSKISFKNAILSPLREEKSPSFTFKRIGNKIVFRDWGSGLYGDAFNFVQKLHLCSFNESLYLINNKLGLNLTDTKIYIPIAPKQVVITEEDEKQYSHIDIESQMFTLIDYKYWKQYGISLNTLVKYNVHSCKFVWLNGRLMSTYSSANPIYAYAFKSENKIKYKIYKPFSEKKFKWISNVDSSCIEGYDYLDWIGDIVILTKSLKDVMCLRELGYNAFSLHGESNVYPQKLHEQMTKRFSDVIVFYDNDITGIERGTKISEEYSIKSIHIPIETETKDISDFVQKYGIVNAKELITNLLKNGK